MENSLRYDRVRRQPKFLTMEMATETESAMEKKRKKKNKSQTKTNVDFAICQAYNLLYASV